MSGSSHHRRISIPACLDIVLNNSSNNNAGQLSAFTDKASALLHPVFWHALSSRYPRDQTQASPPSDPLSRLVDNASRGRPSMTLDYLLSSFATPTHILPLSVTGSSIVIRFFHPSVLPAGGLWLPRQRARRRPLWIAPRADHMLRRRRFRDVILCPPYLSSPIRAEAFFFLIAPSRRTPLAAKSPRTAPRSHPRPIRCDDAGLLLAKGRLHLPHAHAAGMVRSQGG